VSAAPEAPPGLHEVRRRRCRNFSTISDSVERAAVLAELAPLLPAPLLADVLATYPHDIPRSLAQELIDRHAYPRRRSFVALLNWHLKAGTRHTPRDRLGISWTDEEFATACGARNSAEVRRWRTGKTKPQDLSVIESALFGSNRNLEMWKVDLRAAYDSWPYILPLADKPNQPYDTAARVRREEAIKAAERRQRPAAYRFTIRDEKIDLSPEQPDPEDPSFARDTYQELVTKAQELRERLRRTNSAHRPCGSIERLLLALNGGFENLRPGVLMSRVRSIEADQAAFDSEDARGELFADALAMMSDTVQTARDLMSVFPVVRRIEAERLALDLDRRADTVPTIQGDMLIIAEAAATQSKAVTDIVPTAPPCVREVAA
jgi:hypothetical protein